MDFIGAALPNLMFLVGILAIGLGLGIELKIVSLNKEIDKTGRIGAFAVGIVLIGASIIMYTNPSLAGRNQPATATSATQVAPVQAAALPASTSIPPVVPPTEPSMSATAAPAPLAETTAPAVMVPNLHGKSEKDALQSLLDAGLKAQRADACTGSDQADPKAKKGRVMCQNPAAGQAVARGSSVGYVLKK